MIIDKNNYEAFILDYLEDQLSDQDKTMLFEFLEMHPELKNDLEVDTTISLSADQSKYKYKDQLQKHPAEAYNLPVKDYLLIKQLEEGLTKTEESELTLLVPDSKIRSKEVNDYSLARLTPDIQLKFTGKYKLKRFSLYPVFKQAFVHRAAAVVATLALISTIWFFNSRVEDHPILVQNKPAELIKTDELADAKILEKTLITSAPPSKDSLLKLSNDPMELKQAKKTTKTNEAKAQNTNYLAAITHIERLDHKPINAFEYGLNVMMPQYLDNNLISQELASIYRKIETEQESPSLSLALVESGVKVMNFLSKDEVKMEKYYNEDGKIVGYQVKGNNLEVNRRADR